MAQINLKGMGVALITPFKDDESIDFDALSKLIEYQIQNGIDYLVVLGTTAETPTLTEQEKNEVLSFVIERVKERVPIVLGLGGNNTRGIVERLKTESFQGVDAILSVYLIIINLLKRVSISIIKRLLRQLNFPLFFIMCPVVPV